MPTDNPKISLYVPQQIYDRFKSFQEERKLSMSQAGIVILAEYFGIEETIKDITEGTTIGGVTLVEFEQLKERIKNIEELVEQGKTTSEPPKITEKKSNLSQLELLSKSPVNEDRLAIGIDLLSKRLGFESNREILRNRGRYKGKPEKFLVWSRKKDPDSIGWLLNSDGEDIAFSDLPLSNLSEFHAL